MKLKLLYKSYSARGVDLKKGDVVEMPETEAARLLRDYPGWFAEVSKPEEKPDTTHGNLGGGGPHKETKPVKGHVTK